VAGPFPGMDPWLEHPALWPDVHGELIFQIRFLLQQRVRPRYYVAAGERVYLESPREGQLVPDAVVVERHPRQAPPGGDGPELADTPTIVAVEAVEVREHFLELRDLRQAERVVTVIEVLSPANKRPGAGRGEYVRKQEEVLASEAHLVEVDLLRGGRHTVALPPDWGERSPYRVVVSRAPERQRREAYLVGLRERLPRVGIPLAPPDADVVLDLSAALEEAYARGAYDVRAGYPEAPAPPLAPADAAWAAERVAAWRAARPDS